MFTRKYFAMNYFTPRYFPPVDGEVPVIDGQIHYVVQMVAVGSMMNRG
jgi:hypothetical protein